MNNEKKYKIQDKEAGNVIENNLTLEDAIRILKEYEETDRKEGNYSPDFYEIVEDLGSEYLNFRNSSVSYYLLQMTGFRIY